MTLRQDKVSSLIKESAAAFLQREAGPQSIITVTKADISKDMESSTIYISVYPEDKEEEALNFTKRKRGDFREYMKSRMDIRTLPRFEFEIDKGEKNRRRIEELSRG